jgi:hypothetical protein
MGDSAGQEIDSIAVAAAFIVPGYMVEVQVLPEFGGVNTAVFDLFESTVHRVQIVNRKQAGNSYFAGHGRYQPGGPVVAMNQVRFDSGNNMVDDLALKG